MRKLVLAVFMLFVPAVASAWTFSISVTNTTAGIAAGNKATVTVGSTSTIVTAGTKYFYPSSSITSISVDVANLQNVQYIYVDNKPVSIASPVVVQKGTAVSHTMSVVYYPYTVQKRDITLNQSSGGLTTLKIGSTTSTTGFTGVSVGTAVDVIAQPNTGYRLMKITVNGQDDFTGTGSTSAVTKTFLVDAAYTPNTVSATFEVAPSITVTLSVPSNGTVGTAATAVASATSNVTPLVYSFTTTCSAETQQGASNTFNFTPVAVGTCSVSVTASHEATHTSSQPATGTLSVISASAEDNWACTNCHASSTPQIVADYNNSAHNGNAGSTCISCHTATAHTANIDSTTVSTATFKVLTNTISGFQQGDTFCSKCHSPTIVTDFAASPHFARAGASSCSFCHGVHYVNAACTNCHTPQNPYGLPWPPTGLTFHNAYTGTNRCNECHGVHNPEVVAGVPYPHFSSYTTAQYVTTNISCDKCHSSAADTAFHIYSANVQWGQTGKSNPTSPSWTAYDFKTRGTAGPAAPAVSTSDDCVRCHTTTGYINYVGSGFTNIAPWGISGALPGGDRTREMIACNACHSPTPFSANFSRRRVGINTNQYNPRDPARHVVVWYGYSSGGSGKIISAKVFDDKGESNICIACHSGRNVGDNIKFAAETVGNSGSFWRNVDFMSPHYMGAAGILFQVGNAVQTGYEFRSADAYVPLINFAHPTIGDGIQGPCVGCHMNGSVKKHLFSSVSSASNGTITAITSTTCGGCHGASGPLKLDAADLQSYKTGYQASMAVIASLLKNRGIYYNATTYPYFFTTGDPAQQSYATRTVNWDAGAPTFKGADVMGACFNLKLLQADGGCWAHNSAYTRRLLYDTIDFLDDGNANNNSVAAAIQSANVDQVTKDKASAYVGVRP